MERAVSSGRCGSRKNLRTDTLDLVQLHCPPTTVFESDEVFDGLDTLVSEGVIKNYGVSVETCGEALAASGPLDVQEGAAD